MTPEAISEHRRGVAIRAKQRQAENARLAAWRPPMRHLPAHDGGNVVSLFSRGGGDGEPTPDDAA